VDYLGNLLERGVFELVLREESLEGATLAAVGEPGSTTSKSSASSGASAGSPKKAKVASGSI
jgi:hypothetical protein